MSKIWRKDAERYKRHRELDSCPGRPDHLGEISCEIWQLAESAKSGCPICFTIHQAILVWEADDQPYPKETQVRFINDPYDGALLSFSSVSLEIYRTDQGWSVLKTSMRRANLFAKGCLNSGVHIWDRDIQIIHSIHRLSK